MPCTFNVRQNGASFISIPQDVISAPVEAQAISLCQQPQLGVPTEKMFK